jgi:hypothetical protein
VAGAGMESLAGEKEGDVGEAEDDEEEDHVPPPTFVKASQVVASQANAVSSNETSLYK